MEHVVTPESPDQPSTPLFYHQPPPALKPVGSGFLHDMANKSDPWGGAADAASSAGAPTLVFANADVFALTTALFINLTLAALSVCRIAVAVNEQVDASVPSSGSIWVVASNGFALLVFLYYLFIEIYDAVTSSSSSPSSSSSAPTTLTPLSASAAMSTSPVSSGGMSDPANSKDQSQQQGTSPIDGNASSGGALSAGNASSKQHQLLQQQQQQAAIGGRSASANDAEAIATRRDILDTVWVVAWAASVITAYGEGGSGGGLTVLVIPVFVVIAPALRVSFVAVLVIMFISVGFIVALFLSHFPGSAFRRFEMPLLPAGVIVNFVATATIAAWVTHRQSKEVHQLSDHYNLMLKIVASTVEHLLLLRTSDACANLGKIPSDLFVAPQEKRVVSELTVFSKFLHELGSYFPPHIADAARQRLLAQTQDSELAKLVWAVTRSNLMMAPSPDEAGEGGVTMRRGGVGGFYGHGGADPDLDDEEEEDGVGGGTTYIDATVAMRKRLSTVMQISLLDFPSYDVKQAAGASQWLSDCALERIEAHEGVVDLLTPSCIVASFNFHKPCAVRHARLACECALSIAAVMTNESAMSLVFSIAIDTTQNVGGTVGTGFKRAEAMTGEGVDMIAKLVALGNILAVPILVTERVQRVIGKSFDTVAVDVADIKWFQRERQRQVTLYELRGSRPRNASTHLSDLFNTAFSNFRRGELALAEEALEKWEREVKKTNIYQSADYVQAKRLRGICSVYRKNPQLQFPRPFARRNIMWQLFIGEISSSDPFYTPLGERLKSQRHSMSATLHASGSVSPRGPGGGGLGSSGGGNFGRNSTSFGSYGRSSRGSHEEIGATPLEHAFKLLGEQQNQKIREDDTGLMSMFVVEDDDDDNNNNNAGNNSTNEGNNTSGQTSPNQLMMSPSYGQLAPINKNKSDTSLDGAVSSASANPSSPARTTCPTEVKDIANDPWTRSNEPIGAGAFSEVFLGLGNNGLLAAMKFFLLESNKSSVADLENEVTLLSKLSHENIVSYVSCAITATHFVIIMEYVSGGSLESLLRQFGPLPLPALKKYLIDFLRGLQYLHSQGSVHCDVKPHNALLHNDGVVKLTDFGSCINATAKMQPASGDVVVRGTPHYMSPEAARNNMSPASDIWSVGITVLELYTGVLPWSEKHRKMSPQNFVLLLSSEEPPRPEIPDSLDPHVKDFVERCLQPDPKQRSTIEELLVSPLLAV